MEFTQLNEIKTGAFNAIILWNSNNSMKSKQEGEIEPSDWYAAPSFQKVYLHLWGIFRKIGRVAQSQFLTQRKCPKCGNQ